MSDTDSPETPESPDSPETPPVEGPPTYGPWNEKPAWWGADAPPTPGYIPTATPDNAAWLKRGVMLPMWAVVLSAILGVCMLCSLLSLASASAGAGTPSSAHLSSATSTATHVPAPTATFGPTATLAPTATPAPPPTATPAPRWTTVQTLSGNGISKTTPFTVNDGQWKIVWSCNPAAYGSSYNLIADLTHPGDQFGDGVVNVICDQNDPSTLHGETMEYTSGTFYLDVNSEASWNFQIQVLR